MALGSDMNYTFQEWEKRLENYAKNVEKELAEIRKCKADIQKMNIEAVCHEIKGNYIRNDQRLILSAPEIIIGNVDSSGALYEGQGSKVIVRGTNVGIEGAGDGGKVVLRATNINQIAEDPGCDGLEHVVTNNSQVVSQARNIVLMGEDAYGAFSKQPIASGSCGVSIQSDSNVNISAAISAETYETQLSERMKELEKTKKTLTNQVASHKQAYNSLSKRMSELLDKKDKLIISDEDVRSDYNDIEDLNEEIEDLSLTISEEIHNYTTILSMLAEINRQLNCFKTAKKSIKKGDDYKNNATGSAVNISAENISLISADGEGNLRTNATAGIDITTNRLNIAAEEKSGKLMKDGNFNINAKTIRMGGVSTTNHNYDNEGRLKEANYAAEGEFILTSKDITIEGVNYEVADQKYKEKSLVDDSKFKLRVKNVEVSTETSSNIEVDDKGKMTKASYKAEGDIVMKAKNFKLESVDYDLENDKLTEKAFTKDSSLTIRTENTELSSTDTEGKATGKINLNAKAIAVKSMDVEKEKRTDDKLAAGSTMLLLSEKMYVGSKSKDIKSKRIQAQSEEVFLFSDKTLEAQQGEAKSVLQLADGNAALSGGKTQIYGDTTINAKAEIKGELKAPKATIDNLEAKSAFKSPNISDGMGVGGGGGGGSLSAKGKAEDAPKE